MAPPTFLDANIFMYAAGAPHPYKDPCVRILTDVETGRLVAAINAEVIQELLYRYSPSGSAAKGIQLCRDVLQLPLTVLPVTAADMAVAVNLFESHRTSGIRARDAVHAAAMQNNGITEILSTDRHFDVFGFLTRIDPLVYP